MPLVATWTEIDNGREFCHTFFGLRDGGALAFFQFADPEDQAAFAPPPATNPYLHVALRVDRPAQEEIKGRLEAAAVGTLTLDHGYCVSVYVSDPDGLIVELTCDHAEVEEIDKVRRESARADLERWLAGDHRSNNDWRSAE
jgi:catechol 2,3-dioxygenase-like lactoylglutathione lyase family enzyme